MSSENKELRKVGLKVTLPRVKILQILENSENKHMSAEDVYKALIEGDQDVGLATVYRVLTQFEAAGLVTRHHFEGGHSVFEVDSGDDEHSAHEDTSKNSKRYGMRMRKSIAATMETISFLLGNKTSANILLPKLATTDVDVGCFQESMSEIPSSYQAAFACSPWKSC